MQPTAMYVIVVDGREDGKSYAVLPAPESSPTCNAVGEKPGQVRYDEPWYGFFLNLYKLTLFRPRNKNNTNKYASSLRSSGHLSVGLWTPPVRQITQPTHHTTANLRVTHSRMRTARTRGRKTCRSRRGPHEVVGCGSTKH